VIFRRLSVAAKATAFRRYVVYLGETSYRGKKKGQVRGNIPGNHPALISPALFERCMEVRQLRADAWGKGAANKLMIYPLSSLVYCLDCGSRWRGWYVKEERRYRDPAKQRGIDCPTHIKSVAADQLEAEAQAVLLDLTVLPPDWRQRVLDVLEVENPTYANAQREQKAIQARLDRLQRLFVLGDIREANYVAMRDELQQQLHTLPVPFQINAIDLEQAAALLQDVGQIWHRASIEEREKLYKTVFKRVYVRDGALKAVEPTRILWALLKGIYSDTHYGDDGVRTRDLCLDRAIC
jgi:hypothetical protein